MKLSKFRRALSLFISSIIIGILGFITIEDLGMVNALYMTILTLSTVGFTEVQELSSLGRVFTSVYILFNLGLYAYAVTIISKYIFEGEVKKKWQEINKDKKIKKMENHVIVCGFGRHGIKATQELLKHDVKVVVIEANEEEHLSDVPEFKDVIFIAQDATRESSLERAGLKKAKGLICSLPNDADNVLISLTAREMNPAILIVVRASDPSAEKKLKRAGADHAVLTDVIGGLHMAGLFIKKQVQSYFQPSAEESTCEYHLTEVKFNKLDEKFKDKRISDINHILTDVMVIGYKRNNKVYINPDDNVIFRPDDTLLMIHNHEEKQ
ncbi:potassium channel protein [Cytophagaceae bacterium ABcell3]|nr:potassium channel protein [Cytophagaceae bacterium ABcell3]